MDHYVKSVIFTVILSISVWEVLCIGPQGTTTITQKGASSASFIQQESNPNPNLPQSAPVPLNSPGRRIYINPNTQLTPINQNPQNFPQSGPQPTPTRAGTRDYVNPNRPQIPPNQPTGQNLPQSGPQTRGQNLPQSGPQPTPTRAGTRDYVNPNRPQTPPNQPINQNLPQSGPQTRGHNVPQNSGRRDYVNPNIPQQNSGTNRGAVKDYVNPVSPNSPQNGQFRPNPRNSNLGSRDYVNPNPPSYANAAGGANFPALPARPNGPIPQGVQSTTPVSYASKVSGVTSKPPIGQKPSLSGPTTSTTETSAEGPTDAELKDFSEALLRRDVNNAAKYLTVNVQGKTTSQSKNDQAPDRLLEIQSDAYKISTISKLKLLHNNYILDTTENEHVTAQEKQEENDLLDAMLSTPVMQYTRNFLVSKGKLSRDPKDFKDLLKVLWFNMYSRGNGRIGSSGFEHIFLAELKNNEVSGLHNWVYFDQAEMNKIVDYLGYMKKIDLGEKGAILKFHFKLNGVDKPVGSMFIGTSPELEMALYTTCYMFRAGKICPLRLNGNNFIVRTYNYRYRGKNMIGSAFPEI